MSFLITDVGQLENMKSVEATLHPQLKGVMLVDMYDELKRLDEENKPEEKAKVVKLIECLRDKNIQVCDFEDVIEKGRKAYIPPFMHQDPERIFTLVYTSGQSSILSSSGGRDLQAQFGPCLFSTRDGHDRVFFLGEMEKRKKEREDGKVRPEVAA